MKLSILPLRHSVNLLRYRLQSAPFAFLFLLLLWCKPDTRAQTFVPSTVPESVFPLPGDTSILPAGSGTYSLDGPYSSRFRGSVYNGRIGPISGVLRNIMLWGINDGNVSGIDDGAFLAYKITNSLSDTGTYMRGFADLRSAVPMSELQLSIAGNSVAVYILAAYWQYGYKLNIYQLNVNATSSTSGLTFVSTIVLDSNITDPSGRISMFGYDYQNVGIVWERPGVGLFAKGVYLSGSSITLGNIFPLPNTSGCRFPDIAANSAPTAAGSAGLIYHFAFVDTAALQIKEASMGVYDLLNYGASSPIVSSTPSPYIVEDTETIAIYNPSWDGFQLHIVSPIFGSRLRGWFGTGSWAYTYYNSDTNKIYVRTQSSASAPATYVVNDGSLGNGDITMAANAFPTITYTSNSKICIGWYTTFDPTLPAGANPLYSYTSDSKKYIALEMQENGTNVSDYLEVSSNYTNNNIGEGLSRGWSYAHSGYPFIAFGKRSNDIIFASYACHGLTDIWGGSYWVTVPMNYCYPRDGSFGPMYTGEANYVATKVIQPITPPVFRLAQPEATPVFVMGNPFTDNRIFQLQGDNSIQYELDMTAMDGRRVYTASGLIPDLNSTLRFAGPINSLQPGVYILHLNAKGVAAQTFKLVKQ